MNVKRYVGKYFPNEKKDKASGTTNITPAMNARGTIFLLKITDNVIVKLIREKIPKAIINPLMIALDSEKLSTRNVDPIK